MNQRTAAMYLTLAESWSKKGQPAEAMACLEKVTKLSPELAAGRHRDRRDHANCGRTADVTGGLQRP